jgi:hypothetical protein
MVLIPLLIGPMSEAGWGRSCGPWDLLALSVTKGEEVGGGEGERERERERGMRGWVSVSVRMGGRSDRQTDAGMQC